MPLFAANAADFVCREEAVVARSGSWNAGFHSSGLLGIRRTVSSSCPGSKSGLEADGFGAGGGGKAWALLIGGHSPPPPSPSMIQ